jgi:hypothetical protein
MPLSKKVAFLIGDRCVKIMVRAKMLCGALLRQSIPIAKRIGTLLYFYSFMVLFLNVMVY